MTRPLPEEDRIARDRARKQAWWDANPNYRAEHREKNLERLREQNREYMRAQAAEKKRRAREVERVREWSKQNPEKRRAARARYKAANPEKYREAQREYYHRNKEAIRARRDAARTAEQVRAGARRDYEKRDRSKPAKPPSPEQRERHKAQEREKKRVERALARAGLPPRRLQRVLAFEKRNNAAAADEFFDRRRTVKEVVQIRGQDGPTPRALLEGFTETNARLRERLLFRRAVDTHQLAHATRLHRDVLLDSRAREIAGKPPYDTLLEVRRRAADEVREAQARQSGAGRLVEPHRSGAVLRAGSVRELVQANVRAGWRVVPSRAGVAPQQLFLLSDEFDSPRLLTISRGGPEVREFDSVEARSVHLRKLNGGSEASPVGPSAVATRRGSASQPPSVTSPRTAAVPSR
jgi:hypothetical protein